MSSQSTLVSRVAVGAVLVGVGAVAALQTPNARASSHSDAPLIKQDPQANLTDVYAFVGISSRDPSVEVLNVIANVRPFSEPGDGPHYERFASDARYSLHITDPATGATVYRYDFEFSPVDAGYKNEDTILSYGLGLSAGPIMTIGDDQQNFTQTYSVTRRTDDSAHVVVEDVVVAPPNAGKNVTPLYNDADGRAVSGAATNDELDAYTQQAIVTGGDGVTVFAGPRDDSFYADVPGVFDLLDIRILDNNGSLADGLGQDGGGVDGFKGFNVLTFGLQIPLDQLPASTYADAFFGEQTGVGIYASVSRPSITRRIAGNEFEHEGPWIQVNRLGNPLFNEALVAFVDKDRFNATDPQNDTQFSQYAAQPELAGLINLVFGTDFQTTDRQDLVNIFIPDVLRVATTTGPVPLNGQAGFSRFGFVGGDQTGGVSSGWPNGRRFGDDVIDIALTAIASGPTYKEITVVGDNVAMNDVAFHAVFPYAATPHSGVNNRKDPVSGAINPADLDADGDVDFEDLLIFLSGWTMTP
ncbi:MAG: DUF4331 domain-containing protein [Phycisphaerales bacterium]